MVSFPYLFLDKKKDNTLQTAAFQPHGGIALYRDILANVLDRSTSMAKLTIFSVQCQEMFENMPKRALPHVAIETPSEDEITSISHSPNEEPASLDFSALDGQVKGTDIFENSRPLSN